MNEREHLTVKTMDDYLEDLLSPEDSYCIDVHLGSCEECANKVRVLREFNLYWEAWSPALHGIAYQEAQIEIILAAALARNPGVGRHVREWLHHWGNRAGAAVKVLWKLPGEITRIAEDKLDQFLPLIPGSSFSLVTAEPRVTGEPARRQAADRTKARMNGDIFAEVTLDESHGFIEVLLHGIRQSPPLVLLVAEADTAIILARVPEYQLETNSYICRFEQAPPGRYIVLLEPWE